MLWVNRLPSGRLQCVVGTTTFQLKQAQAEQFLEMLFLEMPNVPNKLKAVWDLRTEPRGRMTQKFKVEGESLISIYHLEVFVPNAPANPVFEGKEHKVKAIALLRGRKEYGEDIEISENYIDRVSEEVAKKGLEKIKLANIAQNLFGMSLKKLMEYVAKHGGLPPEAEPSVSLNKPEGSDVKG